MLPSSATPLTPRQQEVAGLIVRGFTDKQIADALHIGVRRVGKIIGAISRRWELNHDRDVRVQIAQRAA